MPCRSCLTSSCNAHSPGSEWIYYRAEEDKVARSATVMDRESTITAYRLASRSAGFDC
jgi:hypothetical protein